MKRWFIIITLTLLLVWLIELTLGYSEIPYIISRFFSDYGDFLGYYFIEFGVIITVSIFASKLLGILKPEESKKIFREKAEEAFNLLKKGYEQKNLSEASIRLIYDRLIPNSSYDNIIPYIDFLESFLIYIRKEDSDGDLTKSIETLIYPILQKEKEEKPYTGVQEGERRILLAIEESANKSELSSLKKHLEDLAVLIQNNQRSLDKAERTNKWTIPTSIVGVFLTVFFGLYSIWGTSISSKEVQNISEKVSKKVTWTIDSINKQAVIDAEKKDSLHNQNSVKDKK